MNIRVTRTNVKQLKNIAGSLCRGETHVGYMIDYIIFCLQSDADKGINMGRV